jgi:hypothetical protein
MIRWIGRKSDGVAQAAPVRPRSVTFGPIWVAAVRPSQDNGSASWDGGEGYLDAGDGGDGGWPVTTWQWASWSRSGPDQTPLGLMCLHVGFMVLLGSTWTRMPYCHMGVEFVPFRVVAVLLALTQATIHLCHVGLIVGASTR